MTLPSPDSPDAPKYWMYEQGDLLKPAITRFLHGHALSARDIVLIRAYICQWIGSSVWTMNPGITNEGIRAIVRLRLAATKLSSEQEIRRWLFDALGEGIDPL